MMMLTKENIAKLPKLYSTEKETASPVIVKFFAPWSNWTWYAIEGEQREDGDWLFFGLVQGQETELGYFCLSELTSVRGRFGLKIERDRYFDGYVVDKEKNEVRRAA